MSVAFSDTYEATDDDYKGNVDHDRHEDDSIPLEVDVPNSGISHLDGWGIVNDDSVLYCPNGLGGKVVGKRLEDGSEVPKKLPSTAGEFHAMFGYNLPDRLFFHLLTSFLDKHGLLDDFCRLLEGNA